jgi:deoxycytidine triphosphate deaminase
MTKNLIVIVGMQGAGKSTLIKSFLSSSKVKVLKPSTTRNKRNTDDDEYLFCDIISVENHAWVINYKDYKYGLSKDELNSLKNEIGITVFEPSQFHVLQEFIDSNTSINVITVALNNIDSLELQKERVNNDPLRSLSETEFDSSHKIIKKCNFIIKGELPQTQRAIESIVNFINSKGGVIPTDILSGLMSASSVIMDYTPQNLKVASYDLTLGADVWCQGKFITLSEASPFMEIPAYSYAIVSAAELANLPCMFTARFGLKNSLFFQGVILSNGPQIDPGYRGALFCMLYNGRDSSIKLRLGMTFSTIEFISLSMISKGYTGKYQDKTKLINFMSTEAAMTDGGKILERTQIEIQKLNISFKAFKDQIIASESNFRNNSLVLLGIGFAAFVAIGIYALNAASQIDEKMIEIKSYKQDIIAQQKSKIVALEEKLNKKSSELEKGLKEP